MKFGASSWPFQWDPPYEDVIKRVAANGFKAIELIGWNQDYLRDYYTPATIKLLKSSLNGEGLMISQFVSTPHDLSAPDKARRAAAIDHWKRTVEVGVGLGSKIINMVSAHPFGFREPGEFPRIVTKPLVQTYAAHVPTGLDWNQNFLDYVDALKACAKVCQDARVMMSVEPHPHRYLANNAGALRLLEYVGSPAMGVNFDPSHTFPMGEFPNISVYQLGKHIIHCHASDNDGLTNVHWRPGGGKIDWRAMFEALKDVGYDGVISIELEDVPGVSRGTSNAAGVFRNPTATREFVDETVAGMNYLKAICRDLGIKVEE
ncbi:MAG: sugar phosphate isomerase/epimerase family protein [Cucumibacter sp.]